MAFKAKVVEGINSREQQIAARTPSLPTVLAKVVGGQQCILCCHKGYAYSKQTDVELEH